MNLCFSLIVFALITRCLCQQKALLKHLFEDYRKELRPIKHKNSGPTNVTVQLYFKQIQKIEENDQILTLYCWLEEYWLDEFLTWNPADFDGLEEIHVPADMVWKPDLLVYNNANMNVKDNEMQTNVLVQHTGRISLFRAIITDVTCDLDMQRFPYDQQICFIMLASWSYDGSQIMLQVADPPTPDTFSNKTNLASLVHYIPNMEWDLVDFKYKSNLKFYDCCPYPYPDISYFFAIKRNASYYLFTLIIPSAFITIVTVVGFFTPHSSTGENTEKVSLGVTALLSLAIILMMVSDKLPATSNSVPLLGQYYIGLILIMFAATYCTTYTLSVQMRGNAGKAIPRNLRQWILKLNSKMLLVRWIFGRELENAQQSIKMRMKKFDKLTALKKNFARDCVLLQKLFIHADQRIESAMPIEELRCDHRSPTNDAVLNGILSELLASVKSIRQDLIVHEHLRMVRKEWQMVARMLEKILMLIFAVFTFVFAVIMLYDDQELPVITDLIMSEKGRAR
ncbi:hypothetical protein QR680_004993 [Steinernema hermaphroditum]|uniref:Neurotransmitter-gated ion-channel ligand-binding domain-containing protein n=1 Tax=Steinernema hermaphroditum TaxID=289476 RepID=A0AA39HSN9_9BILA|nr:hypothetical protein QR680_004993 [Steinernema hermaphroditum]